MTRPLAVGFDLDLTLIDTRAATAYALRSVNRDLGERIDVDAFVARLGPPIRDELLRWVPESRVDSTVAAFRKAFTGDGLRHLVASPGAADALEALRYAGGRSIVITSRRPEIAVAALHATGPAADIVVGGVTGTGKAPAIREHGVTVYVGDHPLDMAGGRCRRGAGRGCADRQPHGTRVAGRRGMHGGADAGRAPPSAAALI